MDRVFISQRLSTKDVPDISHPHLITRVRLMPLFITIKWNRYLKYSGQKTTFIIIANVIEMYYIKWSIHCYNISFEWNSLTQCLRFSLSWLYINMYYIMKIYNDNQINSCFFLKRGNLRIKNGWWYLKWMLRVPDSEQGFVDLMKCYPI